MTDWADLTKRTLTDLETCAPQYRPTSFWGPGLEQLLGDMEEYGLAAFKSWPSASFWFYPRYGNGFTDEGIQAVFEHAKTVNPALRRGWLEDVLTGSAEARRDFDAVRLAWNRQRWPINIQRFGEDNLGNPPQRFPLTRGRQTWTKPYLNYLLCLAALSQHVDKRPRSFLELGGGFGTLGEVLMRRSPDVRYVDLDIPPLVTVSSYYLRKLFGERVAIYDDVPETGRMDAAKSAVLPNWRIGDVGGPFDVFVNSFSFQEMEPDVVEHYVDQVAAKGVEYVVSLNSRQGKLKASDGHSVGVIEPVTSRLIIDLFLARGYVLLKTYGRPLIRSAGELAVLRRDPRTPSVSGSRESAKQSRRPSKAFSRRAKGSDHG